jgi:hypothetical protein
MPTFAAGIGAIGSSSTSQAPTLYLRRGGTKVKFAYFLISPRVKVVVSENYTHRQHRRCRPPVLKITQCVLTLPDYIKQACQPWCTIRLQFCTCGACKLRSSPEY